MYLEKIKLNKDKHCLEKGLEIELKPITLLVGDQGCGKSTLLELMINASKTDEYLSITFNFDTLKDGKNFYYFDSEKMNPRITDPEMYTNPNGTSKGIGVGAAIASRFKSHGEILKEYTVNGILDAKDSIILLDEPESALSLKNQFQLAKNVLKVVENDCQIIIATHCLPLIEEIGEVYSLEHNRWMKSEEFINLNKVG